LVLAHSGDDPCRLRAALLRALLASWGKAAPSAAARAWPPPGFVRQAEAGMPIKEIGRKHGFSDASFYKWRAKFGDMDASEAKRLRELELENGKLKRLLAEAHLDIHGLKGVLTIMELRR
jgi:putative transposase